MRIRGGTSGFSYDAWKGHFYPAGLKSNARLRYYAGQLDSVEINNSFYRMPKAEMLERWRDEVPEDFVFVLKAPQRITHMKRLQTTSALALEHLIEVSGVLGGRRGPFLFQTPPSLRKDLARLQEFLGLLPAGVQAAFEFRHESWQDDEVRSALTEKGAALCLADTDDTEPQSLAATGSFGYLRLRRADYDTAALARWAEAVLAQPWQAAYVFFKHEDEGKGPAFAQAFRQQLVARGA